MCVVPVIVAYRTCKTSSVYFAPSPSIGVVAPSITFTGLGPFIPGNRTPTPPGNSACVPPSIHATAVLQNGPTFPCVSAHLPQYTTRIGTFAIGGISLIGLLVYD